MNYKKHHFHVYHWWQLQRVFIFISHLKISMKNVYVQFWKFFIFIEWFIFCNVFDMFVLFFWSKVFQKFWNYEELFVVVNSFFKNVLLFHFFLQNWKMIENLSIDKVFLDIKRLNATSRKWRMSKKKCNFSKDDEIHRIQFWENEIVKIAFVKLIRQTRCYIYK